MDNGDYVTVPNLLTKFLIETDSIRDSSPALLSRVNLITINHKTVKDQKLIERFIKNFLPKCFIAQSDLIIELYKRLYAPTINYIKQNDHLCNFVPISRLLLLNFIEQFDIFCDELFKAHIVTEKVLLSKVPFISGTDVSSQIH